MKRAYKFKIEYKGETYTAIYERGFAPMWAIYKGNRKVESRYIRGYQAFGDTMFPSQVKEKFIRDMEKK